MLALALTGLILALTRTSLILALRLALRLTLSCPFLCALARLRAAFLGALGDKTMSAVIFVCPGEEETKDKYDYNPGDDFVAENSLD